jgi:hypothetical protein
VRVPKIVGAARQRLRVHWGNPAAKSESDGSQVFGAFNGYVSTLHLEPKLADATGRVPLKDEGTATTAGMIGEARHLDGNTGLFGGDKIEGFPTGAGDSTSEVWFRPERVNTTVFAWGQEQRPGKVMFNLLSPPHMAIQCYFADVDSKRAVTLGEWIHVVHTYQRNDSRIYINGALEGATTPLLDIPKLVRLHIGGWHGHGFRGDVDEVRVSNVARSPEWIRLQYENQKPLQTLVGPIVAPGDAFRASVEALTIDEGKQATITAQFAGAQKLYWLVADNVRATVQAVDQATFTLAPGRVQAEQHLTVQLRAVYPNKTRSIDIPVTVRDSMPEPVFALAGPAKWDGRSKITIQPEVINLSALKAAHADSFGFAWHVDGLATVHHAEGGTLVLERAMNSGTLTVMLALENGGIPVRQQMQIAVTAPSTDPFEPRPLADEEAPEDHQFFPRERDGRGTLVCRGTLASDADAVFLRVTMDGTPFEQKTQAVGQDRKYDLRVRLAPGLVHYRAEFGITKAGNETVLRTTNDLVCGDAILIEGQSNALATDFGEPAPTYTSDWVRTFGSTSGDPNEARQHIWGNAVCRAQEHGTLEIGSWGLELGKRWAASSQVPICIINGAQGGTRIDQHQRNEADPTDVRTIYGRWLWRIREAKLTHGIRAVLWHQGENDQGADGPTGRYGYETYRDYFVAMAGGWQRDLPNLEHRYVFQIWPKACSMGVNGSDNMLREVQRQLPRWFARMSSMSTLGIDPPGGCHFPHAGWAQFATLIQPLLERDLMGRLPKTSITPPDLQRATFADAEQRRIVLQFDQPVVWDEKLAADFWLAGKNNVVAQASTNGNQLILELKEPTTATAITYLDSARWNEKRVLRGSNGIAALTFCNVPIEGAR